MQINQHTLPQFLLQIIIYIMKKNVVGLFSTSVKLESEIVCVCVPNILGQPGDYSKMVGFG